jgi:uncharacterized protein (TIGR00730 family)
MEAANKGAYYGASLAVGLNIELPHEQASNSFQDVSHTFHHFFARKVMFVKYADAFVIYPGGYGTLDELFEALTLIQTKKIQDFPVILMGADYWAGLIDWIKAVLLEQAAISPEDVDLLRITDDPAEACEIINAYVTERRSRATQAAPATKPIEPEEVEAPATGEQAES